MTREEAIIWFEGSSFMNKKHESFQQKGAGMTKEELVCDLRNYAKMTEEPPTGRAIEGQEEIMRRAADMIENSVEIDRVLEIIDNVAHTAFAAEDYYHNEGGKCVIQLIREAVEELKGGEQE